MLVPRQMNLKDFDSRIVMTQHGPVVVDELLYQNKFKFKDTLGSTNKGGGGLNINKESYEKLCIMMLDLGIVNVCDGGAAFLQEFLFFVVAAKQRRIPVAVLAIELDDDVVQQVTSAGRGAYLRKHLNIKYVQGDLLTFPFKEHMVDCDTLYSTAELGLPSWYYIIRNAKINDVKRILTFAYQAIPFPFKEGKFYETLLTVTLDKAQGKGPKSEVIVSVMVDDIKDLPELDELILSNTRMAASYLLTNIVRKYRDARQPNLKCYVDNFHPLAVINPVVFVVMRPKEKAVMVEVCKKAWEIVSKVRWPPMRFVTHALGYPCAM